MPPTEPKYDYDIQKVEDLQNEDEDLSLRGVAAIMGYGKSAFSRWLKRNYKKTVKYVKRNH